VLVVGVAVSTWQAVRATRAEAEAVAQRDLATEAQREATIRRHEAEDAAERLRQSFEASNMILGGPYWEGAFGRFKEAERSYQQALELDPSDHQNWYYDAVLRLQLGDVDGYRRVCREMLARFRETNDPGIAERTAKTCLLVPDAVSDLKPVLQLADRAVTGTEQDSLYRWFLLVKGMADYRAGKFGNAVDPLNKTLSLEGDRRYFTLPYLKGMALLFLAMAHHRLGQTDLARKALDHALELMEQKYPKIDRNEVLGPGWDEWLRFHLVRHEAELLVKGRAERLK
jgi:tetratricopeptide (TPR) repeat protein